MGFIRENILKIITFIIILVVVILIFSFAFKGDKTLKSNSYSGMEENLKRAAQKYTSKNSRVLPENENEQAKVSLDTLISSNTIKELTALEDENVKCSGYVNILKKGDNYKYIPYIKCGKYYETKTLVDYIKSNEKIVTNDDGLYKYGEKYVYKGENPNNYLSMGDKIYRIIEINENNELKLISSKRYNDSVIWDDRYNIEKDDNYGINNYSKSRLKDSLSIAYKSEFFTDEERSYIIPHDVCIGKRSLSDVSIDSTAECSDIYPNQNVSLITVSDYMRASVDLNCSSTESESCSNYNYFENISSSLRTITAVADDSYQVYSISYGKTRTVRASASFSIYPVVYIDRITLYGGGNGTIDNPYKLR